MATLGTKEAAELLKLKQATVAKMCREGRIEGAEQDAKGSPWHIPEATIKKMLADRK